MLTFDNNEKKIFDVKPYFELGKFEELRDLKLFNSVRVSFDTIEWSNHLDLDPETLYHSSSPYEKVIELKDNC